jgi:c-di-GMP-binding flagellar brake protein YcgR
MFKTDKQNPKLPFNLWDKIEVVVGEDSEQGTYVSRIEDINRDGIVIAKPAFVGGNKLLTANSTVFVHFMRPDALYSCSARMRIIPGRADGQIQLYNLGSIERVQRRQFVRVDMRLELKYAFLKHYPSSGGLDSLLWYPSYSSNVSAGGLLMKTEGDINKSDLLLIKIGKYELLGIPRLVTAICCRVVRMEDGRFAGVEFITDRKMNKYFSAPEIVLLPSQVKAFTTGIQNKLVRYIFEQQIKERQKGLL